MKKSDNPRSIRGRAIGDLTMKSEWRTEMHNCRYNLSAVYVRQDKATIQSEGLSEPIRHILPMCVCSRTRHRLLPQVSGTIMVYDDGRNRLVKSPPPTIKITTIRRK